MEIGTQIIILLFIGYISAYPGYRDEVPNSRKIIHPTNRTRLWTALGHRNPDGGGPRNNFGRDFAGAGHKWTQTLCKTDSDGDGKTNGQELGDPDCVWVKGATPAVTDCAKLSHPGICDPVNATICASTNAFLITGAGFQFVAFGLFDVSLAALSLVFVVVFA